MQSRGQNDPTSCVLLEHEGRGNTKTQPPARKWGGVAPSEQDSKVMMDGGQARNKAAEIPKASRWRRGGVEKETFVR